jgi:hypothetical protein
MHVKRFRSIANVKKLVAAAAFQPLGAVDWQRAAASAKVSRENFRTALSQTD